MAQSIILKTVIHEETAAAARLAEIALDLKLLVEVVTEGERARAQATAHDPVNAASLDAYRYRVRGLRDTFVPHEWTPERIEGLELLRSPCGRRVIMTRAGDDGVGRRGAHPQPLRTFGEVSARAVAANASLSFDPDWYNVNTSANDDGGDTETWILLVHYATDGVRSELSHPSGTSADGRVDAWIERIILPVIDFESDPLGRSDEGASAPEVIDVPVTRKR